MAHQNGQYHLDKEPLSKVYSSKPKQTSGDLLKKDSSPKLAKSFDSNKVKSLKEDKKMRAADYFIRHDKFKREYIKKHPNDTVL